MEYQGILREKIGQREGDGQRGHWVIASYLVEQEGMYPKKMVVDAMNSEYMDLVGKFDSLIGKRVVVWFNIDAHEWQGKWFNSIRAHGIKEDISDEERQKRADERKTARKHSKLGTIETPEGTFDANEAGTKAETKDESEVKNDKGENDDLPF